MILTRDQVNNRLNSQKNILGSNFKSKEEIETVEQNFEVVYKDGKNHDGRGHTKSLTHEERVTVGVLAHTVGNEVAATLMGISENTARHIKTGQTTINKDGNARYAEDINLKTQIQDRLERTKLSIQEQAAVKLLDCFGLMTPDKLENSTAKDLASITSQMSNVIKNMTNQNKEAGQTSSNVKIIIHQPKTSREDSFDVVEISG